MHAPDWSFRTIAIGLVAIAYGFALAMNNPSPAADNRDRFVTEFSQPEGGPKMAYAVLKPKEIVAGQKYPLVLFLHGAGERGSDGRKQLVHGMNDFASDEISTKYPCFILAPQCPDKEQWVNVPWSDLEHTMPAEPSWPLTRSLALVDQMLKDQPIDSGRVYVTGLSMGGYGTWDAIQRRPSFFAAAAPVCGGGDKSQGAKIAQIPLWAFHGEADTVVKPSRSRDMIAAMKSAGGKPQYTEYPKVGHNSWSPTYSNPDFYAWLFAQKK